MISTTPSAHASVGMITTEAKQARRLSAWHGTDQNYPRDVGVHVLFEAQVAAHPHALAVTSAQQAIAVTPRPAGMWTLELYGWDATDGWTKLGLIDVELNGRSRCRARSAPRSGAQRRRSPISVQLSPMKRRRSKRHAGVDDDRRWAAKETPCT